MKNQIFIRRNLFLACLVISLLYADQSKAQQSIWGTPDAYLGQQPPGDTPQVFARQLLNSNDTFPFDRVAFSPDGTEFYYPSSNTWFNSVPNKIRYLKFDGRKWNGPFVLIEHHYAPAFSMDGQTLYLEGGSPDTLRSVVWQIKRTPQGSWTQPAIYLSLPFGLYDYMPTRSGISYIGSNGRQGDRKDFQTYDFCELRMSPSDTVVRSLGPVLNTPGFDGDFFIAPDESYIIISTKETKDFECELYISFHRDDRSWTRPVSLGPLINDGVAHRWGEYVSPDGKYLFYSKGHSPADCQIWWVRFDRLKERLRNASL